MQLAAFTSDHFPMGQAAMQVNEGLPAYIVAALERRYGGLQGKTVGILGMAFKSESDDTRASLRTSCASCCRGPVRGSSAPTRTSRTTASTTLDCVLEESDILVLGAPHKAYRGLEIGGKDVVDVWGAAWRRDQALKCASSSPAQPDSSMAISSPSCSRRATTSSASTTSRKYGRLTKSYDEHPRYRFVEGDAKDVALLTELAADCDQVVAAAAMIGGISYFHEFAYDLLAENERILASTFDAAIAAHKRRPPRADRRRQLVDGLRVGDGLPDARGRPAAARRRRSRPTASRSSRRSTSPRAPGSSTSCRTRSSGRSTASASASAGRCATPTS